MFSYHDQTLELVFHILHEKGRLQHKDKLLRSFVKGKAWSPYSRKDRKHRPKLLYDSVQSNFEACEHCLVSSSCDDRSHCPVQVSSLVPSGMADLYQRIIEKQLQTPLRVIAPMNFLLKKWLRIV